MFNASGACFDLLLLLLIVVFCVGIPLQFIYSMYLTKCTYISVFAKLKSDRQLNRKKTSSQRRKGKGHHNTGEKKTNNNTTLFRQTDRKQTKQSKIIHYDMYSDTLFQYIVRCCCFSRFFFCLSESIHRCSIEFRIIWKARPHYNPHWFFFYFQSVQCSFAYISPMCSGT